METQARPLGTAFQGSHLPWAWPRETVGAAPGAGASSMRTGDQLALLAGSGPGATGGAGAAQTARAHQGPQECAKPQLPGRTLDLETPARLVGFLALRRVRP